MQPAMEGCRRGRTWKSRKPLSALRTKGSNSILFAVTIYDGVIEYSVTVFRILIRISSSMGILISN